MGHALESVGQSRYTSGPAGRFAAARAFMMLTQIGAKVLRKRLLVIAGIVVSVVAVYFFIARLKNPAEMWKTLREARVGLVLLAALVNFTFFFTRSLRWQLFLRPTRAVGYWPVFRATCIGFMANNLIPARVGEIARPYILHRKEHIPFTKVLATSVGLERPFDMVGLVLLMLLTWPLLPVQVRSAPAGQGPAARTVHAPETAPAGPSGQAAAESQARSLDEKARENLAFIARWGWVLVGAAAAGVFGMVAAIVLVGFYPEFCVRVLDRLLFFLPHGVRGKLVEYARLFTEAMGFMRRPGLVALAAGQSLALWVVTGLAFWTLGLSLGLKLPVAAGFFCVVVVAISVALPQAPAFIGVFPLAAAVAMSAFGVETDRASAYGILLWIITQLPVTLVGLLCLSYEGISFSRLTHVAQSADEDRMEEEGPAEGGAR